MPSPQNPPPFISKRHLQAIGNLATYWTWFEIVFDSTIWALLRIGHRPGAAVTMDVGTLTKIDSVKILAFHELALKPERQAHLDQLIKRIDPLRIKRNTYVHHWWFYNPHKRKPKGWRITAKGAKGDLRITESAVSASEIEHAAHEIWDLTLDWMCFLQATFPRYRFPWPKLSRVEVRQRNMASRSPLPPASPRKHAARPQTSLV